MHGVSDMHYRSAAHGSFARGDHSRPTDLFDGPKLEHSELSQAAMLRELAWLLVGCAAVVVAVDVLGTLFALP